MPEPDGRAQARSPLVRTTGDGLDDGRTVRGLKDFGATFYEKGEDRFWTFVWPKVRAVHDLDDTREHSFGTIYTPQKPLTLASRAEK